MNGESTAGSHHLGLGIAILLLLHGENGRAKPALGCGNAAGFVCAEMQEYMGSILPLSIPAANQECEQTPIINRMGIFVGK